MTMRRRLGYLAFAGALTLALLGPATATAQTTAIAPATSPATAQSPVGVWTGTVSFPEGHADATMSLLSGGNMCLVAPPPGPDGGVQGTGTWKLTSPNTFTFKVTERFFDGAGRTTGFLRATHNATQQGDQFTTTATATFYDECWNPIDTFPATAAMHRTQTQPTGC